MPWPSPAALVAAVTVLACGAALSHVGGGAHGEPAFRTYPRVLEEAYRYNASATPAPAEVLLLGNSLMHLGVIEDELAEELCIPGLRVVNLAMHGADAWAVLQLVRRLDPPRVTGPRIAVIALDRAWFDDAQTPTTDYARYMLGGGRASPATTGPSAAPGDGLASLAPERRDVRGWASHFRYGWLAGRFPGLIRPPGEVPRLLWTVDPATRRRAVAKLDRAGHQLFQGSHFALHSLHALRAVVRELQGRSYRVVLMLTPLQRRVLDALDARPETAALEAEFRARVLDPSATGADAVLTFRDAAALGGDESIFVDYGHLTREGALRQTHALAEALVKLGLLPEVACPPRGPDATPRHGASG